jgi:hypothetical protein
VRCLRTSDSPDGTDGPFLPVMIMSSTSAAGSGGSGKVGEELVSDALASRCDAVRRALAVVCADIAQCCENLPGAVARLADGLLVKELGHVGLSRRAVEPEQDRTHERGERGEKHRAAFGSRSR